MKHTNEEETAVSHLNGQNDTNGLVELQLDNLITLLSNEPLDYMQARQLQEKIHTLTELLNNNAANNMYNIKLESPAARNYNLAKKFSRIMRIMISLLLILLGFGMIIMPAPEYFEMFTLFYLNPNDGVTIMDVISLIVAFTGISLLISAILKFNTGLVK